MGQVPSGGRVKGNHTLMFLSLSLSLPSPLSKIFKKKKKAFEHYLLTTKDSRFPWDRNGFVTHLTHLSKPGESTLSVLKEDQLLEMANDDDLKNM